MARKKKERPEIDLELYTKTGKPRKRKRKKPRRYFNEDTENAIIEYNSTDNFVLKNKLFKEHIDYSIHKLAENIINTFKFDYIIEDIDDLKHEVVVFLLSKMNLYDPSQGRAYSYFGTIAKRYLIALNDKNYKKLQKHGMLIDVDEDKNTNLSYEEGSEQETIASFFSAYIKFVEEKMDYYFIHEKDLEIVNAILNIFKSVDDFTIMNKQVLYMLIREQVKMKTSEITNVIKMMKEIYKRCLKEYYLTGCLSTQELNFDDIYI